MISARDLAVFADEIFNGDFLQPETLKLFTSPVTPPGGTPTGYSFGWQMGRSIDEKTEWYGHGGEINGAYASVRYYPASTITVAGMTNYDYWLTSVSLRSFMRFVRNCLRFLPFHPEPCPSPSGQHSCRKWTLNEWGPCREWLTSRISLIYPEWLFW